MCGRWNVFDDNIPAKEKIAFAWPTNLPKSSLHWKCSIFMLIRFDSNWNFSTGTYLSTSWENVQNIIFKKQDYGLVIF